MLRMVKICLFVVVPVCGVHLGLSTSREEGLGLTNAYRQVPNGSKREFRTEG